MRWSTLLVACLLVMSCFVLVPGTAPGGSGAPLPQLVPSPPWSGHRASDPLHGIDPSRHPRADSPLTALTGNATVLAILINFNDTTNTSAHTSKYYDDLLFNESTTSMNKYYKENSYNAFGVKGAVTSKWYTATHSESWYGSYETWGSRKAGYGNSRNLTYDAVMAADADIDFSSYDKNGDGEVDNLMIIHSGKDDASDGDFTGPDGDPQMWSHAWSMYLEAVKLDGVWIDDYTMLSEDDPLGVYAHEFGHDIGLPDLYDYDYGSEGGVGDWCLMATGSWNDGGDTPSQLCSWCRIELGWVTATVVNSDSQGLQAKRLEDNAVAYKVWVNFTNGEYFLMENRQQTLFDTDLPGNGLLIFHVNESAPGNDDDNYRLVDLEEADGDDNPYESVDPWKNTATGFTGTSTPNTKDYSGKSTGIRIYNISSSGSPMTFDVDLGNTAPNAPAPTAPDDGAWTKVLRPVLNWTFSDPDSGDAQTAYELEVDDDQGFGSLKWDSNEVEDTSSTCTAGADLGEGKWYWRVKARDGGGLWSAWSSTRSVCLDLTPPAAPQSASVTPSGWTATDSFGIDWTDPSETGTSGIETGVYYKLDSAPVNASDGTWSPSKPLTGIKVTTAGSHTIYLWLRDKVGNSDPANRTTATLEFDNAAPTSPSSLSSSTHSVAAWSNVTLIKVQWSGAADADSGLGGYSYLWDSSPTTVPDAVKDAAGDASELSSTLPADGTYYFHIRSVDNVDNWAGLAAHLGPFYLDTLAAGGVAGASSTSHVVAEWSNLSRVGVQWWGAADGGSGVGGYSLVWDGQADTLPDELPEADGTVSTASSPALADGTAHYFHVRVMDRAGNWNATAFHLGPFRIDTQPPSNPDACLASSSGHSYGKWSSARQVVLDWSGFSDGLSGVDGFSFEWSSSALTLPDLVKDAEENGNRSESPAFASGVYWFHVRTRDAAGNWNGEAAHFGPFMIDIEAPTATSVSDEGEYTGTASLRWNWSPASDGFSGVGEYELELLGRSPVPGEAEVQTSFSTGNTSFEFAGQDGWTYFLSVRAQDGVGNAGPWSERSDGITVDLSPPRSEGVVIDNATMYTVSRSVHLNLSAQDNTSGVADMRFSLDGTNWTEWMPFSAGHRLELAPGDGEKVVFFQARDLVGNVGVPAEDRIILDTEGPEVVSAGVEGDVEAVNATAVRIVMVAEDGLSGTSQVRLSADGKAWSDWKAAGQPLDWELSAPDGEKAFWVQARDLAGNVGGSVRRTVLLDTKAPGKPAVTSTSHPRSDTWYNSTSLQLRWTAPSDPSGIAGYGYLLVPDDAVPELRVLTANTTLDLTLPGGGVWHFRVRALDGAGNWGESSDLVVRADLEGPLPPLLLSPGEGLRLKPDEPVDLQWGLGNDTQGGLKGYAVQVDDQPDFSSPAFDGLVDGNRYTLFSLPKGEHAWRVRARDGAGNWGNWSATGTFKVANPPAPPSAKGGLLGTMPPFFLPLLILIIVVLVVAGAAAAGRRKKEPPAPKAAAPEPSPVSWATDER